MKLLEQQLKEKRDQIAVYVTTLIMNCLVSAHARVAILLLMCINVCHRRLQRVSNVVLWEREKKRLLENCRYQ